MELTKEKFREEVTRFRSAFKEDAMTTAEKSVTLEKRGEVGIIWLDQHEEKANKLSSPNMLRLFELFVQIDEDPSIQAIVLMSRKPTIFIAGADIAEIEAFTNGRGDANDLMRLQAIPTYLERMEKPSIAAINGATMGGGLEMALACDYRMVTDAPETKLALPEVMLGVIPGWGGTQRLPKMLGLEKSLDLILTGKSVDGRKAKKLGIADRLVPKENLEERAVEWAKELAKTKKKAGKEADMKERLLEVVPGGKWVILDQAKKKVLEKTKGHYPAPLRALDVIRKTYGGSLDAGLKIEAQGFVDLVRTPECKNLIKVFYLQEKVKKDKGVTGATKGREVQRAGVLGAGAMGGGIAQLFAEKNVRVRLRDLSWDAITKGYAAAYRVFKKQVERRKIKQADLENAMERIEGSTTYGGFKSLDLVVEAVVEDLEIKKKVFRELEANCGPQTILATNTSSLSVTSIGQAIANPSRVVGMHFFNPVDKMPLVEVIRGKDTSDEAIATVFSFSKRIGKTPIVVKDGPGFVVNRILTPYMNEAVYLMVDGVAPSRIDRVLENFGMPMGPCTLLDEVGLDVGLKVSKVLYGAFGERMKPFSLDIVMTEKRFGKKTGKGIYLWEDGGKKKTEDPQFYARVRGDAKAPTERITDDQIEKRTLYVMVNEAARCLEEEIVRDVADIDIGMIFGTGFAPFRGGLLRWADSIGPEAIVSELEILSRNHGPRFAPSTYLQQLAVSNKKFYP